MAEAYRDVVPRFARDGVHNVLTNLNSPVVLANDVLQARPKKAANTFGRIVINSTVGLGGLIDVAGRIGIPCHENDFGVTLGKAGTQRRLLPDVAGYWDPSRRATWWAWAWTGCSIPLPGAAFPAVTNC